MGECFDKLLRSEWFEVKKRIQIKSPNCQSSKATDLKLNYKFPEMNMDFFLTPK